MTETAWVRCPGCRQTFRCPLQVDRGTLETMVVTESWSCPHCGTVSTYHKADIWYQLACGP